MDKTKMAKVLQVNNDDWKKEVGLIDEHFARFGSHLPKELATELDGLKKRLG
ncbi:MAG: phosphoenolpyruvate carboxykinase domain-containing protein [Bacteroidales bacterium]|jgi:phosphoenolpyruvate carboxykinase (GTP)|nr:phosphoenolpyruvate carboxykinase domain-containing protein [Bacteroidales bacterium]